MTKGREDGEMAAPEHELDQRVQEILGRSLKAHFDDIVSSPMPDRFLVLLSELEAKESGLAKETKNV